MGFTRALLVAATLVSAGARADRGEIERFLTPGEELVRHGQTRAGADVGITTRRLLVVSRKNLVEQHFFDTITHAMVHSRGLSLRLKSGRILGLNLPMPQSAQLVVDLSRRASGAEFQIQSGDRARLKPGFTIADIEAQIPPPAVPGLAPSAGAPARPADPDDQLPPKLPPPADPDIAAVSPVYLYVDLGDVDGLSAQIAMRKAFKRVPLTLLPDEARLFASAKLEKATESDTSGTLLGLTKMKSYSLVFLVQVGNRNGDVYASDRVQQQVLGISAGHAVAAKGTIEKIAALVEQAIVHYARVRAETGSPFVLQDPFAPR